MDYVSRKFFFTLLYPTFHSLNDIFQEIKGFAYYLDKSGNINIKKPDFDDDDECFSFLT